MNWFRVKKADIDPEIRRVFEERGAETVRTLLPNEGLEMSLPNGKTLRVYDLRKPMLLWLKEQYDREERKETWLITMEAAITIFVAAELVMSIIDFCLRHSH